LFRHRIYLILHRFSDNISDREVFSSKYKVLRGKNEK
jgi:hypothetical protein